MFRHGSGMSILTPDDITAAERLRGTAWPVVSALAVEVGTISGVDPEAIMGRCRTAVVCHARAIVMFAAERQGISRTAIGRALARDVSTVTHGIDAESKRRGWK